MKIKIKKKILKESLEAEFFNQLGQSFVPIVNSLKQLLSVAQDALSFDTSLLAKIAVADMGGEIKTIYSSVKTVKGQLDRALSGFTQPEKEFLKKRFFWLLKTIAKSYLRTDSYFEKAKRASDDFGRIILYNCETLLETAKRSRNLNIEGLNEILPALKSQKNNEKYLKENFKNQIKYKGNPATGDDFKSILKNQTKIADVFDLLEKICSDCVDYVGKDLKRLKKVNSKTLFGFLTYNSILYLLAKKTELYKNKAGRAVEMLFEFEDDFDTISLANKIQSNPEKEDPYWWHGI